METSLEKLIEKSVNVRASLSRTLTKNFPIEQDFADFLAMDIVNQAIGVDALERYNNAKLAEKQRKEQELEKRAKAERIKEYKSDAFFIVSRGVPALILLGLVGWAVFGMYSCATAAPYPRTYTPIPEKARFADVERSSWNGDQVYGLNDESNLCVSNRGTMGRGGVKGSSITCIHRNKVESLNTALQTSVEKDINGVIWNEPNGNGEVWEVIRNNYRFVITATGDDSFVAP